MAAGLEPRDRRDDPRCATARGAADAARPRRGRGRRLALGHRIYGHRHATAALYRTAAINVLAVDRAAEVDRQALRDLPALRTVSGAELIGRIDEQMDKSTQGLLAMRVLTLLAALVAVAGIIATAVLARRREWAVLRAMGLRNGGLFGALALETGLVMVLGGICGAIAGIVSYVGPDHRLPRVAGLRDRRRASRA